MAEGFALFMLITPIDLPIARYSVRALGKLFRINNELTVYLYCNGLDEKQEAEIIALSKKVSPQIQIQSNRQKIESIRDDIKVGEWYITDQGNREYREGYYENCGEVWTRELVRLPASVVGLIDADFEILKPAFVTNMLEQLSTDMQLAFFSTDYGKRARVFETYSQTFAYIATRYTTWFCLYRRSALEKYCNFTYVEEVAEDGLSLKYDHSAKLQEVLTRQHNYHGKSLEGKFQDQYIHYGAFAKNRSLKGGRLWLYRLLRIGKHNGWIHIHRSWRLARVIRSISSRSYNLLRMSKYDRERQQYLHE